MMLTPKLEELIWNGKAKYMTHIHAVSGAGTVPVPENSFVIVIGFTYYDFIDTGDKENDNTFSKNMARRNTQVTFTDTKNGVTHRYAVRDNFTSVGTQPTNQSGVVVGGAHRYFDCYLMHKNDIAIDILKYQDTRNWGATTKAPFTPGTYEPPVTKGGYGKTIDVIQTQDLVVAGQQLVPAYKRARSGHFDPSLIVSTRNEYIVDGDATSAIQDILQSGGDGQGNQQYPILNIDYILINDNPPADIMS